MNSHKMPFLATGLFSVLVTFSLYLETREEEYKVFDESVLQNPQPIYYKDLEMNVIRT